MSFYDDASIVMIPSGYKASKLYSAKPTDGAGDLTFSRTGSTATRVNESGLIEKCRTNLLSYSEQFENAYWTKSSATITENNGVAPDGTISADKIIGTAGVSTPQITRNTTGVTASIPYTLSVFAKKGEYSFIYLQEGSVGNGIAWFDLENGVVGTKQADITSSKITSFSNGWYKCEMTFNQSGTTNRTRFGVSNANNVTSFTNDGTSGILIWGAQVEIGDIATDYIPTTAAAVTVGPIANLPRLDYTGGGCPKLLMEPTRTNLAFYSEQFENAYWSKTNTTITANNATSPDGYISADKLIDNSTSGIHSVGRTITAVISTTYVFSCFVKKAELDYVILSAGGSGLSGSGGSGADRIASVNLTNGNIVTNNYNISAISFGNGWYRISITLTTDTDGGTIVPYIATSPNGTSNIYVGSGQGVYVYGAQLEAGSYATSYIPTVNASVTRNADSAFKENIAGTLPTAYPFTLFAEFEVLSNNEGQALSFSNTASPTEYFTIEYLGGFYKMTSRPSTLISTVTSALATSVGFHKICGVFTSTTIKLFVDGVLAAAGANAQAFNSSVNDILLGQLRSVTDTGNRNPIKQALVFKSELSDAEAISLTA